MQQLKFEASWDKAIATEDRQRIERIFNDTKHLNSSDIICTPIQEALNHKMELLVTVLVHNFSDSSFTFDHVRLHYYIQGVVIADKAFTLPTLAIPSKVSMPWTFIFPKEHYQQQTSFENGRLEII